MGKRRGKINSIAILICILFILPFVINEIIETSYAVQPSSGYFIMQINEEFENISNFTNTKPFYTTYKIKAGTPTKNIKAGVESENMFFVTTMYQGDIIDDMPSAEHPVSLYYNKKSCPFKEKGIYRYIITPIMENLEFHFNEEEYIMDVYVGIIKKEYITQVVKDKDGNIVKNEDGTDKTEKVEKNTLGIKSVLIYNKDGKKVTNINGSYNKTPEIITTTLSLTVDASNFLQLNGKQKPDEIIVAVYQYNNGTVEKYIDVILNNENNYVETIKIPKTIGNITYQYYVEQHELEFFKTSYNKGNSTSSLISNSNRIIISNTYNAFDLDLNVNFNGIEADSEKPVIALDIYRNDTGKIVKNIILDCSETLQYIITLPKNIDGINASYYLKTSHDIEGYGISIDKANASTNAVNTDTIINVTCERRGTTELPVTLYWSSSDDYTNENISVSLYANGKIVQTKSVEFKDGEKFLECNIVFKELQMYNNGLPIQYKLKIDGNEKNHIIGSTNQDILKDYILSTEMESNLIKIYIGEKMVPEMGISTNIQYSLIIITIVVLITVEYVYMKKKTKW